MPGKHRARIGRQSRAKRSVWKLATRGPDKQKRMAGGESNSARKLEDIGESINLLMRREHRCRLCGGTQGPTANTIIVKGGLELWVCDHHANDFDLLPSGVGYATFELYAEA